MSWHDGPMLRGRPIPISFLGFRSDTYELQRHGWEIVEERDVYRDRFRLLIRHSQHRMSGISDNMSRDSLFHYAMGRNSLESPVLEISIAVQYMVVEHGMRSPPPYIQAVDTTPQWIEEPRAVDLYDAPYFRPIEEGAEVFLKRASVDEILQIALDKQEPEQAEIRARQRRENYKRGGKTAARLIMVA